MNVLRSFIKGLKGCRGTYRRVLLFQVVVDPLRVILIDRLLETSGVLEDWDSHNTICSKCVDT